MTGRTWVRAGVLGIAAATLGGRAVAQTPFSHAGFDTRHPPSSSIPIEHVDPASGTLTVAQTDLLLPGNAGFDLVIQRVYSSAVYPNYAAGGDQSLEEDSWAGVGWRLHFGRILHADSQSAGQIAVEMGDGSRHPFYHSLANPNIWTTADFWLYNPGDHTLQIPDGRVYTFGREVNLGGTLGDTRYVTEIHDVFQNRITFTYFDAPGPLDGVASITQYLGGTETRQVTFAYGSYGALSSMSYNGHTWLYDQQDAGGGYSRLTAVHPPVGVGASYGYGGTGLANELTTLSTGMGGTVAYVYTDSARRAGPYSTTTRVVMSRSVSGRSITNGTWGFSYGTGTNQDTTVVTCPCGTTRYTFFGTGINGDFSAWSAGVLSDVSVEETNGTVLEHRHLDYARSDLISNDPVTGVNGVWTDGAVFRALLNQVTIIRGAETWTTGYTYNVGDGTFNDFGQPSGSTERRSTYQYRNTTRTFRTTFGAYLTPKVATQSVSERYTYGLGGANVFSVFTYDDTTGFLLKDSEPETWVTFEKSPTGNVAARIDAKGHRTSYSYDWGVLSGVVTAHQQATFSIAPEGFVTSATVGGVTTTYTYDDSLRPWSAHPPSSNAITVEYDNTGGSYLRIARDASQLETVVDGFGRPIRTSNQVLLKTRTDLDACGRPTFTSAPYTAGDGSRGTTVVYDALGRPTRVTNPAGKVTTFSYSGARVTRTDANQRTTIYDYLALYGPEDRRFAAVTDATGTATTYTYTTRGNLTSVTGPNPGVTRSWSVDDRGRPLSDTQPESGTTTYTYDEDGKLSTITDASGGVTSVTYDTDDRPIGRDAPGTVEDLTVTYDTNGRVSHLANGQSSTTYTYDGAGRLATRTDTVAGFTFPSVFTYDANENLALMTYPSGRRVSYTYDAENRLTRVLQQPNGAPSPLMFADSFAYGDNGALASYTTGAVSHTFTYDTDDRIGHLVASGSRGALDLTYGYDNVGNVTSIADPRPAASQSFAVDALDRLSVANGPWGSLSWTYDAGGNRLTENSAAQTTYTYNTATQRLASAGGARPETFGYDALGRLTSDAFGTYSYTPTSHLATATGPSVTASFVYDAAGERLTKTVNGETTYTARAPDGRTLSEYAGACVAPVWTRDVIYAGARLIGAVRAVAARPTVSVSPQTVAAGESSGSASVSIVLTTPGGAALACPVTVTYTTTAGTGRAALDYTERTGTITFAAGVPTGSSQSVSVPILSDTIDEDDETVFVDLTGATGADLGAASRGTLTITDDDPSPSVSVAGGSVTEGNSGTKTLTFTITASNASGRDITVNFSTVNGTALAGQDYTAANGTARITAGSTATTVLVTVIGDTAFETNETFSLQLSNPVAATLGTASATGTIVNDDADLPPRNTWGDIYTTRDGLADGITFGPSTHLWTVKDSATGATMMIGPLGDISAGDLLVPADYTGDGRTDCASFRPSTGVWTIAPSCAIGSAYTVTLGQTGDTPVPADYDGDGKVDPAVWRNGYEWWIRQSSTNTVVYRELGMPPSMAQVPIPGDYDGDHRADVAVYCKACGGSYVLRTSDGTTVGDGWGIPNDARPVILAPGDYDGDGKTDHVYYDVNNLTWHVLYSSTGQGATYGWGVSGALLAPADYDGDGKFDVAYWNPSTRTIWVWRSTNGLALSIDMSAVSAAGDVPALWRR
jgi:YD repeat-containing protein